jgi:hypothetical protein
LTTEPYLCSPEFDHSRLISMFGKLCMQSGCDVTRIGVRRSREIWSWLFVHPPSHSPFSRIWGSRTGRPILKSHTIESDLIYWIVQRVDIGCKKSNRPPPISPNIQIVTM